MRDRLALHLSGLMHRLHLLRWERAGRQAAHMDLGALRRLRTRARQLRHRLDGVTRVADSRLALPRIGGDAIRKPPQTDWAFRPEAWRAPIDPVGVAGIESRTRLGAEAMLFHDCAISEITARQVRNSRVSDLAPFGLQFDVFRFDGGFLSLVVDLPHAAVEGLTRDHLIRAETVVETEKPLELFLRLNIRHGPNTEQVVRELPPGEGERWVEFDLAYTQMNEKRLERFWLDIIFEGPQMNQITLRDLTLSRRPRAAL